MNSSRLPGAFSAGIIFLSAGLLQAQLIDVDFNNNSYGTSHGDGGPDPGPTMSGAAVLGNAGDQWNGISASSGSGISLFNADGSASTVTMTFTSDGGYNVYNFSGAHPFAGTPYDALMQDYLFNGGVPQTITLSGLAINSTYNLVLYNAADAAAAGRETFFTVNGNTQGSVWDGASSTLIAGVDYVDFPSALSDGLGNLVITYTGNGSAEGDVDGFQIQAVPQPAPLVTITDPPSGDVFAAPANVNITAIVAVSSGTVTNVQFFTNGVSLGSAQTAPFSVTASNLTAGAYALTAVATAAGMSGTSIVVNVTVLSQATAQANNASAYTWTTLAGHPVNGSADGVGSGAQFNQPRDVAVDASSNIYVADTANFTIRKVTAAGVSSTIAGFAGVRGSADGVGSDARFSTPTAVAVDGAGNLYVTDAFNNYTIRKITPVGTNWVVSTIAGLTGSAGGADGTNTQARFNLPDGIAVDSATNLYVTDGENDTVQKITQMGTNWVVNTVASNFFAPTGIAVDSATNLYVADTVNDIIWEITPAGTSWVGSIIAGLSGVEGTNDGAGSSARFFGPTGIGVDTSGNLYVTDNENNTLRKITPSGPNWVVSTLAGRTLFDAYGDVLAGGSADGTGSNAQFNSPGGVALDSARNIYVADSGNNAIRKSTSAGVVSTLAGLAGNPGTNNGVGGAAQFNSPDGIAVDSAANVYVADQANHTIRSITSAGEVTTIAGLPGTFGTNDGVGSNARFHYPAGVAVNSAGNVYVADYANNTIRLITFAGVVSTLAGQPLFDGQGNPVGGSVDASGSAAQFNGPLGVAVSAGGIVYVADSGNQTIRKMTPHQHISFPSGTFITTWAVTTIAGSVGQIGTVDGTNTGARFYFPCGIAIDSAGNLYVVGEDLAIRKLTPIGTNWVVSTLATLPERFVSPDSGIALDGSGNIFVPDYYNSTIQEISPVGTNWVVTTIGGLIGGFRGSKDGAGSDAQFNNPTDIAVDSAGNLYVADTGNNTIRKGVFAAYTRANPAASMAPAMNGALGVTLVPPEAGGQWRFPWEQIWHNSGEVVSNLAQDNYSVEFRSVPGYLTIQTNFTVAVTNGGTTFATNQYYATVNAGSTGGTGTLTVNIGPNSPAGSGWRFLGETLWRAPGDTVTNLLPDIYFIEFEPVSGRSKPDNQAAQVYAGLPTTISANYLLAATAPANVLLPFPVPAGNISDLTNYPFGFNGQLQSDVGFGSGVAAQANVVLTAAHLVFNDQTLSYVSQAYWYFRRETGANEPEPQAARGWYVLSGYASQRTNDLQSGLYGPDQSTPQSRNLDVTALYFLAPMAGGGFGGYLPSDTVPNPWLSGNGLKMLVGYPVDGSLFGDASIVPGQMYQTSPQPYALSLAADPVEDQQVYTAPWFLSYPGNSGGPVYAQFNGYYYPAGVYLGTAFNGSQPYASLVRGIDSNVVSLITLAASLGDTGTNNSGGGVITIIPSLNISRNHPGYLILQLGPPSAVQAGAAWELAGQPASFYSTANPSLQEITNTNALMLQFKPIPGWNLPTNRSVTLVPGVILTNVAAYTVTNPALTLNLVSGLGISGTTNTSYQIQSNSSLAGGSWVPFKTNTLTNFGFNLITNHPHPGFYRALWLTNSP